MRGKIKPRPMLEHRTGYKENMIRKLTVIISRQQGNYKGESTMFLKKLRKEVADLRKSVDTLTRQVEELRKTQISMFTASIFDAEQLEK